MISLYAIIYTMLLSFTNSLNDCNGQEVSSKSECKNLPFDSKYSHCCFSHYKMIGLEIKTCAPLTKEEYDKIDEYIKSLEKQQVEIISIDCISYYLHTTILALLLFILI